MDEHITVCICTRNRGDSISATLRSIAVSAYHDFDVIVVDQSEDGDTERAVQATVSGDQRFRYIRSVSHGLSVARNLAVDSARGPILAFTDDDCEVAEDWLPAIAQHFRDQHDVGQVCGIVQPAPYDTSEGFIPASGFRTRMRINSPWLKWREKGIGANMSFRLDTLRQVGPFDEILGAGGSLYTCEDADMTYRVLRAGFAVLNVTDAVVLHYGFRNWTQGRVMMRNTGTGVGATYTKHLRLGDVAVLPTLLIEWMRCISWGRLATFQKRTGLGRFLGYTKGIALSFRYPIDAHNRVYIRSNTDEDKVLVAQAQEIRARRHLH